MWCATGWVQDYGLGLQSQINSCCSVNSTIRNRLSSQSSSWIQTTTVTVWCRTLPGPADTFVEFLFLWYEEVRAEGGGTVEERIQKIPPTERREQKNPVIPLCVRHFCCSCSTIAALFIGSWCPELFSICPEFTVCVVETKLQGMWLQSWPELVLRTDCEDQHKKEEEQQEEEEEELCSPAAPSEKHGRVTRRWKVE